MPNLLIGTPCYNSLVYTDYMLSMLGLQAEMQRARVNFSLELTTTVSLIPIARNFIVARLLEDQQFTHLLFIDADLGFEPATVTRFLQADKDVVAGIYPLKQLNVEAARRLPADKPPAAALSYAVRVLPGAQPSSDGFVQAEYAATGFMLIKREVLERMAAHYAELKYNDCFTAIEAAETQGSDFYYALFDSSIDRELGQYLPEDYTFCRRWRALGGEIWVDVFSRFTHTGTFAYRGDFSVFLKRG